MFWFRHKSQIPNFVFRKEKEGRTSDIEPPSDYGFSGVRSMKSGCITLWNLWLNLAVFTLEKLLFWVYYTLELMIESSCIFPLKVAVQSVLHSEKYLFCYLVKYVEAYILKVIWVAVAEYLERKPFSDILWAKTTATTINL